MVVGEKWHKPVKGGHSYRMVDGFQVQVRDDSRETFVVDTTRSIEVAGGVAYIPLEGGFVTGASFEEAAWVRAQTKQAVVLPAGLKALLDAGA